MRKTPANRKEEPIHIPKAMIRRLQSKLWAKQMAKILLPIIMKHSITRRRTK
jgi:hypothetical protein